jgi:hypothetical protein
MGPPDYFFLRYAQTSPPPPRLREVPQLAQGKRRRCSIRRSQCLVTAPAALAWHLLRTLCHPYPWMGERTHG